ncbi:hypothetical protein [Agrobacterium sp. Azo12]|uniref:hypothetical protein n=1 Tax=Agrobacterium sp. Azo12 TaxID=3031129 RepID=UPI0023D860B7|nr:hypothetical protein [Agrobacterium sp. Azo12]MDO5897876.1 hypothetical protein [Agrobacterium sp. Azo12]
MEKDAILHEVEIEYSRLCDEFGGITGKIPFSTAVDEFGVPYIRIVAQNELYLSARDRGAISMNKLATSPSEFARLLYEFVRKASAARRP